MSRRLFFLGCLLLLATVALWVGDATGLVETSIDDHWSHLTLKAGVVALAVALVLRMISPISGRMAMGRCTVCGKLTERGHMLCLDHLQETVNTTRDRAHNRTPDRPKAPAHPRV
jgi:hypothetical protein